MDEEQVRRIVRKETAAPERSWSLHKLANELSLTRRQFIKATTLVATGVPAAVAVSRAAAAQTDDLSVPDSTEFGFIDFIGGQALRFDVYHDSSSTTTTFSNLNSDFNNNESFGIKGICMSTANNTSEYGYYVESAHWSENEGSFDTYQIFGGGLDTTNTGFTWDGSDLDFVYDPGPVNFGPISLQIIGGSA